MSLGLTYNDLKAEVERVLGTYDAADVSAILNRGLRQFYTPMPLPGERVMHRWSFLKTVQTLDTIVSTESGTASTFLGNLTSVSIDLSTEDPESISHVTVTRSNGTTTKHLVTAVSNSGNSITTSAAFGYNEDVSFTVYYNGTYALPASFAGIDGPIGYDTYYGTDPNIHDLDIPLMSDKSIRNMFSTLKIVTTSPALRPSTKRAQLARRELRTGFGSTQYRTLFTAWSMT